MQTERKTGMNILIIGDVVGDCGTDMFLEQIDALKQRYAVDFCVVNGENACSGNGISRRKAEMLLEAGADVITLGNHAFRQKDAPSLLNNNRRVIRPINYPQDAGERYDGDGKKREAHCGNQCARTCVHGLYGLPVSNGGSGGEKMRSGYYFGGFSCGSNQ